MLAQTCITNSTLCFAEGFAYMQVIKAAVDHKSCLTLHFDHDGISTEIFYIKYKTEPFVQNHQPS